MEGFEKWKAEVSGEIRKMDRDDRLKLVSDSIRAMVASIGIGISYCIVDPGYGVRSDDRLASNCIAEPKDRSERSVVMELAGNVCCMLESFMLGMRRQEIPDDKIKGIAEMILKDAVQNFESRGQGYAGAEDEGTGPSVQSPEKAEEA